MNITEEVAKKALDELGTYLDCFPTDDFLPASLPSPTTQANKARAFTFDLNTVSRDELLRMPKEELVDIIEALREERQSAGKKRKRVLAPTGLSRILY